MRVSDLRVYGVNQAVMRNIVKEFGEVDFEHISASAVPPPVLAGDAQASRVNAMPLPLRLAPLS